MRAAAAWAAVFLAASASAAIGGEDGLLRPGDSVRTPLAAGERKTISFAGVAGAQLDLRVAAERGSNSAPRVTLLDPAGAVAPAGDPDADPARVARIEGFVLGATGVWRIVLDSPTQGTLTLTTRRTPVVRLDWTATGKSERTFDAAPGSRVSASIAAPDGASLELLAPSGERLARAVAHGGRARISHARLPELGSYTIRVEGTALAYSAHAVVRSAASRLRAFRTVESPPDVRGFSPGSAPNQSLFTLDLEGTGFTSRQAVAVVKDGEVVAAADVRTGVAPGATALLDLGEVPPGTYSLEIRRPGRAATAAPGAFSVTNLPPRIVATDAHAAPNTGEFAVAISGAGFDGDADVIVRPAAGGDPIPVTIVRRKGHGTIDVSIAPPAFFTGPCDLEVRDQDGGAAVLTGALDVFGYRAAPSAVATATGSVPLNLGGVAYDTSRGRFLAALRSAPDTATFLLVDAESLAALDTFEIPAAGLGGGTFDVVQVSWDAVGDTFAICLTTSASPTRAVVRIVSAADIRRTVAEQDLAAPSAQAVSRVHAAPNRDDGGYLVVWDEFETDYGSRIWARQVGEDGAFAAGAPTLVLWDPLGEVGHPTAAHQRNGAFVVAWAGLSEDRLAYAVRLVMTDGAGAPLPGAVPRVAATSRSWTAVARPALAVNPADGATLLTYWYGDGPIYRPGARGIAPLTGAPLVTAVLDEALAFDGGVPGGAVWSESRGEFVVTTIGYDSRVAVQRVAADGTLLAAARAEVYEGTAAVPYSGASAESLGLLRVSDDAEDGIFDRKSTTLRALAGPTR